jgi:hypothetical protein
MFASKLVKEHPTYMKIMWISFFRFSKYHTKIAFSIWYWNLYNLQISYGLVGDYVCDSSTTHQCTIIHWKPC